MRGETTQPTEISKEEYIKFKQFVQDTHGKTRGHLSTEIENALREYRKVDSEKDRLARIEDDIATIKANVARAEADGGSVAHSPEGDNTHARAENTNKKPNPNAPRSEKVAWLTSEIYDPQSGSTTSEEIKERVKNEFGFGDRTAEKYVESVIDSLGAKVHPNNTDVLVWGDQIEKVKEAVQEQAEKEASEEMEKLS